MSRIAIVLIGESFRFGQQFTRVRGVPESYDAQKNACASHMQYIDFLRGLGYSVDVFIHTFSTVYDAEMVSWYGDAVKASLFLHPSQDMGSINGHFLHSQQLVGEKEQYNTLLFLRIDLHLKPLSHKMMNPAVISRIAFASATWKHFFMLHDCPRVNDMMMFVPARYFHLLEKLMLAHETWHNLVHHGSMTHDDFQLLVNTLHDSDSSKDWNPLYWIVNRSVEKQWHSEGLIFENLTLRSATPADSWHQELISNRAE